MSHKIEKRAEDSFLYVDILSAFEDFGYPTRDSRNIKIKGDIKIKMGSSYKEPDVVFYADGVPVLLVEAKREGKSKEDAEEQAKSYVRFFPIEEYSKDGRPPQYAAVTIGKKIFFYKYEKDINEHGGIIDRLKPLTDVISYDDLRNLYGLEEKEKPAIAPLLFRDVFYQLIAALDIKEQKQITPEIILETIYLLTEFIKDQKNYVSRYPYTELDNHPDRQRWIRNLLKQYNWNKLGKEIASQFREEIIRSFQGSKQLNQYITPWSVIAFMSSLVDMKPEDRVLDFECGSGGFLAAAVNSGVPLANITGVDIAELPYSVSKFYLMLNFEERFDTIPVHNDNGLKFWGDDWDVVIGNPAGGDKYEFDDLESVVYTNLESDLDQNNKTDSAWEYNFSVQQTVRSAKIGGRICLVLPEGLFSNSSAEFLRKYLVKYCHIKAIISLPRGVFYKGTTTKRVDAGKQSSTQKMSIILAEKKDDVIDKSGVDISSQNFNYPVFLASIQKPDSVVPNSDWLENILQRVLEDYRNWQSKNNLSPNIESIKFITTSKVTKAKQAKLKLREVESKKIEVKRKPLKIKEKSIIPKDLEEIF